MSRFSPITNGNIRNGPSASMRDSPVITVVPPFRVAATASPSVAGDPTCCPIEAQAHRYIQMTL